MAQKDKNEKRSAYNRGYNAGKNAGLRKNGNGNGLIPTNNHPPVPAAKPVEVLVERGALTITIKES